MKSMNVPTVLTQTGAIKASAGRILAMTLVGGSDTAVAVLDDSLAGSGTEMWRLSATAGMSVSIVFNRPIAFGTGIYATLSGSGEYLSVEFE